MVTAQQVEQALERQRQLGGARPLGEILVAMGLITDRQRVQVIGEQWGIPVVDLHRININGDAVQLVSQELARRYTLLPIEFAGPRLIVAMQDPLNVRAIDELRLVTGRDILPGIAPEDEIRSAIDAVYRRSGGTSVETVLKSFSSSDVSDVNGGWLPPEVQVAEEAVESDAATQPIIQLANAILQRGIAEKASDIHIEPNKDGIRVRYRIDGILSDGPSVPKNVQPALISRIKIMSDLDIAEKRAPQDGRMSLRVHGQVFDFRVSTLPAHYGEKVVLRILDKSSLQLGLSKLGLQDNVAAMYEQLLRRSHGIVLVTGPTGSGKSTTLYASLNTVNSGEKNILTIEDPVEYDLPGITQVGVNNRAGMSFAAGLRAMLRQDPDIIMVGEMRDRETAMIAIEAALTGHLVFSTLHTNDAPGAITRLVDMGVEPFLIASATVGVMAQRLVRRICDRCKEAYMPPRDAVLRYGLPLDDANEPAQLFRGAGCEQCNNSGYRGRVGCYELLPVTDDVRARILANDSADAIRDAGVASGMRSLKDDAMSKVILGQTTLEEVLRVLYAG
jgi:type IV pilus assembly protein PilB